MPPCDDLEKQKLAMRTLAMGRGKTQKTWWACRAAEAGYNVIVLDGEDGIHVVRNIDAVARKKILRIDIKNTTNRAVCAEFMAHFIRANSKFYWNEQAKKVTFGAMPTENSFVFVDPSKLTPNDVLVLDGWTALAASLRLRYASEHSIDMTDAEKTEWDGYGWESRFLDHVLNFLNALACNVIVIAHSTVYEKRSADGKRIVSSEVIPISSSNPAGLKLAKNFADVLHFKRIGPTVVKIEAQGDADRDGGSRVIPPALYDWKDYPPQKFYELIGNTPTGATCEGFVYFATGDEAMAHAKAPKTVQTAQASAPVIQAEVSKQPIQVKSTGVVQMPSKPSIFGAKK